MAKKVGTYFKKMLKCNPLVEFIWLLEKKTTKTTKVRSTWSEDDGIATTECTHHVTHWNTGHLQHGGISYALGRLFSQGATAGQQLLHHLDVPGKRKTIYSLLNVPLIHLSVAAVPHLSIVVQSFYWRCSPSECSEKTFFSSALMKCVTSHDACVTHMINMAN